MPHLIDAHQHFWSYDPVAYPWIQGPLQSLGRDHLPVELRPLLQAAGVVGAA